MFIRNQKGVTLVELMMAMGASTMIAYAIFASMRVSMSNFESNSIRMALQTSGREGLYRMVQEIRESSSTRIAITNAGATITFTVPNPAAPVTGAYGVNWGDQIRYELGTGTNSTRVIRTNMTTSAQTVMAQDVTSVLFTGNSAAPSVVTVALNVQRTLTNGRVVPATALQMTAQARIRNSG